MNRRTFLKTAGLSMVAASGLSRAVAATPSGGRQAKPDLVEDLAKRLHDWLEDCGAIMHTPNPKAKKG